MREEDWRREVRAELASLDEAMAEEAADAARPDSLISQLAYGQPRFRAGARGLRAHYQQLRHAISSLGEELGEPNGAPIEVGALRQRLAWVLAGLRQQRAREADLIYEVFYEAFQADLRAGRGGAGQAP